MVYELDILWYLYFVFIFFFIVLNIKKNIVKKYVIELFNWVFNIFRLFYIISKILKMV